MLARYFQFQELGTNCKTEIIAGLSTFVTMAYVLAVVPKMLAKTGIDLHIALVLVCLSIILSTLSIALIANRPFALAPGLGSVAIAVSMVSESGFSTGVMAATIFISGIVFMIVSFLGLRQMVVRAIPPSLKHAVSAAVGLYIAFIGARSCSLITVGKKALVWGDLASANVFVCVIGFVLLLILQAKKIPAAIIISIIISTILSLFLGIAKMPEHIFTMPYNIIDALSIRADDFNLKDALSLSIIPFVIALFIPDFFSTFGTLIGVGAKAGFVDEQGNMKNIDKCFNVDSSATAIAGFFGIPCIYTYLESSAGVEAGGKSGFSMIIVALCFVVAMFFTPLAIMIPQAATAPAIIYIGICMFMGVKRLDLNNFNEAFAAFVCITFTILASNIANGICVAIPIYIILKLANKDYDIPPLLYLMAAVCLLYFYSIITK